jgi:hypothetical protein
MIQTINSLLQKSGINTKSVNDFNNASSEFAELTPTDPCSHSENQTLNICIGKCTLKLIFLSAFILA